VDLEARWGGDASPVRWPIDEEGGSGAGAHGGSGSALWSESRAEGGKCPDFSTMQRLGRVFDNRCASAIADYVERVVGKIKKKSKRLVGFSIFYVDNRLKSETKHPRSHMQKAIIE
jgi:hypothetical protein